MSSSTILVSTIEYNACKAKNMKYQAFDTNQIFPIVKCVNFNGYYSLLYRTRYADQNMISGVPHHVYNYEQYQTNIQRTFKTSLSQVGSLFTVCCLLHHIMINHFTYHVGHVN